MPVPVEILPAPVPGPELLAHRRFRVRVQALLEESGHITKAEIRSALDATREADTHDDTSDPPGRSLMPRRTDDKQHPQDASAGVRRGRRDGVARRGVLDVRGGAPHRRYPGGGTHDGRDLRPRRQSHVGVGVPDSGVSARRSVGVADGGGQAGRCGVSDGGGVVVVYRAVPAGDSATARGEHPGGARVVAARRAGVDHVVAGPVRLDGDLATGQAGQVIWFPLAAAAVPPLIDATVLTTLIAGVVAIVLALLPTRKRNGVDLVKHTGIEAHDLSVAERLGGIDARLTAGTNLVRELQHKGNNHEDRIAAIERRLSLTPDQTTPVIRVVREEDPHE